MTPCQDETLVSSTRAARTLYGADETYKGVCINFHQLHVTRPVSRPFSWRIARCTRLCVTVSTHENFQAAFPELTPLVVNFARYPLISSRVSAVAKVDSRFLSIRSDIGRRLVNTSARCNSSCGVIENVIATRT